MNLVKFIENRYQELTYEMQKHKDAFDVVKDSEIKATHYILTSYRKVLSIGLIPKVLYNFFEVQMKWKSEPEPIMLNKLKEDQATKQAAAAMLKEANVTSIGSLSQSENPPA